MSMRTNILIGLGAVFVIGLGLIVYNGRPVKQLADQGLVTNPPAVNQEQVAPTDEQKATGTIRDSESDEAEESESADDDKAVAQPAVTKPASEPIKPSAKANQFTMATVATHNKETDCWSAINGSVYDLTSWVARHPGGAKAIIKLCGTDGSASFSKKHGGAAKPQSALALLKIGSLN